MRKVTSILFFATTILVADAGAYCIEQEISLNRVPISVLHAAASAIEDVVIDEAAIIGQGEETVYELEGEANGTEYEIYVDPDGEVLHIEDERDKDK